jgi:hypothetical protein
LSFPSRAGSNPGIGSGSSPDRSREHLALYEGQTAHERVAVLLQLLGGIQRTELPAEAIEPLEVAP